MEKLWAGMEVLRRRLMIWPDPRDLMMAGSKVYLNMIISKSSAAMGLPHPRAVRVDRAEAVDAIRDIVGGKIDAVIKREYSSHGQHVFSKDTKDAEKNFKAAIGEETQVYCSNLTFPTPMWFIQPYIAPLIFLGEIRAFIVNGVLFKTVVTTPKEGDFHKMDIQDPVVFTPLSKLRCDQSLHFTGN